MSRSIVLGAKFLGVGTLGLLSSSALTLSFTTLPTFLSLPSLFPALTSFQKLTTLATSQQTILSAVSGASLAIAYLLSPRRARHPYLIWMGLTVATGMSTPLMFGEGRGLDTLASADEKINQSSRGRAGKAEINGEAVREGMEEWRFSQVVKAAVWGVGTTMGLVGIWGDAY